jgi:hypothetical protein
MVIAGFDSHASAQVPRLPGGVYRSWNRTQRERCNIDLHPRVADRRVHCGHHFECALVDAQGRHKFQRTGMSQYRV